MEAPAPASALIHSATLVSAGIFLLLRLSPVWSQSSLPIFIPGVNILIKDLIIVWGSITAAYGGLVAAKQTDLKKILAYSTISHCGYMMVLVGCGDLNKVIFYFYVHGLFKALLFLATGNIMRHFQSQDFRKMGNAWYILPVELTICIFGFMHLSGAPFSLGFAAKHLVVTSIPSSGILGSFVVLMLLIGACSSVFYSFEFIRCVFFEPTKSTKSISLSYRNNYIFSKYNNPTGNIGLLVLVSYYTFAVILGSYLELILSDNNLNDVNLNTSNYNNAHSLAKEHLIYGPTSESLSVLFCYSILLTAFVYLTTSSRLELQGSQTLVVTIASIFSICLYGFVFNLISSPLDIMNSILFSVTPHVLNYYVIVIENVFTNNIFSYLESYVACLS